MPRKQPLTRFLAMTAHEAAVMERALHNLAMDSSHPRTGAVFERLEARFKVAEPVLRTLDVSTGHLTREEQQRLEDGELPGQCYAGEYGGILTIHPYEAGQRDDLPDTASPHLVAIMREAVSLGCSYVSFDGCADELPGFKTFDTEEPAQ